MKAYYFVFFITLLISLLYQAKTDKQWCWKLFWTFLPLFIFGAIRVDFGNDYSAYEDFFELFHSAGFKFDRESHVEIGYQLLNMIMPSYRSVLVLNAFLLSLSLAVFCYYNIPKQYLWLAIILIFLNPDKNIYGTLVAIRSGLCVSSFLLSFVLIQKRRWRAFFIITGLLATIHTSALLFLPVAYVVGSNKPFRNSEVWLWFGIIVVLIGLSMTLLFNIISIVIENDLLGRYDEVLDSMQRKRGVLLTGTSIVFILLFVTFMIWNSQCLSESQNSLLRVGILFSVTMLMGSLSVRSSYFYDLCFIASVVTIFSSHKTSLIIRYGVLILAILSSYYSMYIVWMGSPYWNHSVYHSLLGVW